MRPTFPGATGNDKDVFLDEAGDSNPRDVYQEIYESTQWHNAAQYIETQTCEWVYMSRIISLLPFP